MTKVRAGSQGGLEAQKSQKGSALSIDKYGEALHGHAYQAELGSTRTAVGNSWGLFIVQGKQ